VVKAIDSCLLIPAVTHPFRCIQEEQQAEIASMFQQKFHCKSGARTSPVCMLLKGIQHNNNIYLPNGRMPGRADAYQSWLPTEVYKKQKY